MRVCVSCGSPDNLTDHHIAPKPFFTDDERREFGKVLMCVGCHEQWHFVVNNYLAGALILERQHRKPSKRPRLQPQTRRVAVKKTRLPRAIRQQNRKAEPCGQCSLCRRRASMAPKGVRVNEKVARCVKW